MLLQIRAPRECLGALRCCKATSEPCCAFKDGTQSFSVESRHFIYLAMPMSLLGGNHLFQGRVHILLQPWNDTHRFEKNLSMYILYIYDYMIIYVCVIQVRKEPLTPTQGNVPISRMTGGTLEPLPRCGCFESFCLQTRIICAASEASCAMHTGGYHWRSRLNKTKGNTITSHGINRSKRTSDKIRKGKTNK